MEPPQGKYFKKQSDNNWNFAQVLSSEEITPSQLFLLLVDLLAEYFVILFVLLRADVATVNIGLGSEIQL